MFYSEVNKQFLAGSTWVPHSAAFSCLLLFWCIFVSSRNWTWARTWPGPPSWQQAAPHQSSLPPSSVGKTHVQRDTDVPVWLMLADVLIGPSSLPPFAGVFITHGDVGVGTIVGSAVFNILCIIGVCGLFAGQVCVCGGGRRCIVLTALLINIQNRELAHLQQVFGGYLFFAVAQIHFWLAGKPSAFGWFYSDAPTSSAVSFCSICLSGTNGNISRVCMSHSCSLPEVYFKSRWPLPSGWGCYLVHTNTRLQSLIILVMQSTQLVYGWVGN